MQYFHYKNRNRMLKYLIGQNLFGNKELVAHFLITQID